MKGYYEQFRDNSNRLSVQRNKSHLFPAHFHRNLEIFILRKGEYDVSVNDVKKRITSGTVVIFDSYDIHSYDTKKEIPTDSSVLLIPYAYSSSFTARRQNKAIATPFLQDPTLCDDLLKIVDEYILPQHDENVRKSAVELFLSILFQKIEWIEQRQRDDTALVREILAFIQANYTNDVSRNTIAHALGYSEAHISRVFHRYLQKGISQYVNELRLAHVEQSLLENPQQSVLSTLYDAGFKSQQTYYRVKANRKR